jgi:Uma2 family endonuclease
MPELDIAVVEPGDEDALPTTALLVIEVAKTLLELDTTIKPPLYGSAGVPDYWVVDVVERRVIVLRDPQPDGYDTRTVHEAQGKLAPLRIEAPPLDLAQLFR